MLEAGPVSHWLKQSKLTELYPFSLIELTQSIRIYWTINPVDDGSLLVPFRSIWMGRNENIFLVWSHVLFLCLYNQLEKNYSTTNIHSKYFQSPFNVVKYNQLVLCWCINCAFITSLTTHSICLNYIMIWSEELKLKLNDLKASNRHLPNPQLGNRGMSVFKMWLHSN